MSSPLPTESSSPTPNPSLAPVPARFGRGQRIAIGCGAVVLVIAVLVSAAAYWLITPEVQLQTEHLITPETTAYVHLRDLENDAGALELVSEAVGMFAALEQQTSGSSRWMESLQTTGNAKAMARTVLPRSVTIIGDGADENTLTVVGAANFRSFTRLIRKVMERGTSGSSQIPGDGKIPQPYFDLDGQAVAFVGGTIVGASDVTTLGAGIERLEAGNSAPLELSEKKAVWDAFARLRPPVTALVLRQVDWPAPAAALVGEVHAGIDVLSADEARAELTFTALSPDRVKDVRDAVADWIELQQEALADPGIELAPNIRTKDRTVTLELQISGIELALEWVMQSASAGAPSAPGPLRSAE